MLFNPTYKYDIVKEDEYAENMNKVIETLCESRESGYFTSFDKTEMFYEYFKVAEPRANIIVVHGYTEFTCKYYELTWYFMNMGYNVFLYDLRCHGNSYRYSENTQMTHVESFDDYMYDLECFMHSVVNPNNDGKPNYIFSHSMGATVACLYLSNIKNNVEKVIFSSPMVYPFTPPLPRFILKKLLEGEAKKFGWDARFKFSSDFNPDAKLENSNDISEPRFRFNLDMRIKNPNYQNSHASNRWNYEAITVSQRLLCKDKLKNIAAKALVISAQKDTSVKVKPQKKLAKMLGCRYKLFENAKHSLYTVKDSDLKVYVDTLIEFFDI